MDLLDCHTRTQLTKQGISSTPTIQLEPYGGTDWAT